LPKKSGNLNSFHFKTDPKQTEVVAYLYITSTASSNSKPHSFPEAETPIPRPPFALKHSHSGCLVLCCTIHSSCKNHFLRPLNWLWQPLLLITKVIIVIVKHSYSNNFFAKFVQFLSKSGPKKTHLALSKHRLDFRRFS
jgi:hypothetical protein